MRAFLSLVVLGLALLLATFGWFLVHVPTSRLPASVHTEAIVVLTGGNGRVEQAFSLLAEQAAPILFVSGVGNGVTQSQLIAAHTTAQTRARIADLDAEIVLDYQADSTRTNAEEASAFVASRGMHSIRLVTANYHMPRSLLEFQAAMPQVEVLPDPAFPQPFSTPRSWWRDPVARRLMFSEFQKYCAVLLREAGKQV